MGAGGGCSVYRPVRGRLAWGVVGNLISECGGRSARFDVRHVEVRTRRWPRRRARAMVAAHLDVLTPEDDEAVLREAGFSEVPPFYAAFTWRGWVAYA